MIIATIVLILASSAACGARSQDQFVKEAAQILEERANASKATAKQGEAPVAAPASLEWSIPEGHYFTQTNGHPSGSSTAGFSVTNRGGALFWQRFEELGGVRTLGYPLSQRFNWKGRPTQVFQRAVLHWDPASRQVLLLNTLDELSSAGKDEWLRMNHATPEPLPASFDAGKPWKRIVDDREALLKGNKAIEKFYAQAGTGWVLYGLPTSKVEDLGEHVTIRFQRTVMREWKVDRAGFKAGELVVENVGEWAIEARLFPPEALVPEPAPPAQVAESDGQRDAQAANAATPPVPPNQENSPARRMRVANTGGDGVFLRRTAHMEDKLVAWPDNTPMQATGETTQSEGRSWIRVKDPAGNLGWVPEQYLAPN